MPIKVDITESPWYQKNRETVERVQLWRRGGHIMVDIAFPQMEHVKITQAKWSSKPDQTSTTVSK